MEQLEKCGNSTLLMEEAKKVKRVGERSQGKTRVNGRAFT